MEGPVYQVPGSRALLAEGGCRAQAAEGNSGGTEKVFCAASIAFCCAQLRKREEKLAKAQKKAEEQLGSPSRWATLFER